MTRSRRPSWSVSALRRPPLSCRTSPPQGGDQTSRLLSPISNAAGLSKAPRLPISPLVGEMSGRTEGGAKELGFARLTSIS
ncbi:hypothetical protein EJ069_20905 [Mesorhizobium sp. M2A.F.Ca.ET.043.05.1.1]|nr:hypothetical protein EJ069_20905 [Mesorhizobium sp. M2A.F.Ca.ET.043.05.1.1]